MKKTLLLLILMPLFCEAQIKTDFPIKFTAVTSMEYSLKNGYGQDKELPKSEIIMFDGKKLTIAYKNGEKILDKDVRDYKKLDTTKNGITESVKFRIKIIDNGMTVYYILTLDMLNGSLSIPSYTPTGMILSYTYYLGDYFN